MLGLRARTALAFASGALLVSLAIGVLTYELARAYLVDQRVELIRRSATADAEFVDASIADDVDAVGEVLRGTQERDAPILVSVDDRWFGASVGTSPADVPGGIAAAVGDDGTAGVEFTRSDSGTARAVVGIPLPRSGADFYQFFSMQELADGLSALAQSVAVAIAVGTLGGALYGLWVSRRLLQPLRETATAAGAIAAGDLQTRLPVDDDPDLSGFVVAFNDMAASLEARLERERRFAADVSHELRTPLTALGSAVQIVARRRDDLDATGAHALDVLAEQVERFQSLLLDILELSQLESGAGDTRPEPVPIRHLVEEVVEECAGSALVEVASGTPRLVEADPRRIRVVVRNLIENAERYAGGATRVGVGVRAGSLHIEVDDAGPGIPEEERTRIFERFHRGAAAGTVDAPAGSGLGLALVAEHLRALGGRVWVGPLEDGGARFTVELPLGDAPRDAGGRP